MGQKYSINSAGRIVAERDIYSLGGFIPKGRVGAKIADETQLSQNGECWVAGGDISTRPDIVIKDNTYIGDFLAGTNPVHTDIITEFSGNTLIPGYLSVRCFAADTKNNTFIKDSFIGVTMDVLFGVSSKCHPVEQGRYNQDAPKGTLFTSASMKLDANNFVRNTATVRLGKDTYVYIPAGFNARIYWAYYDVSNQLAYAGESETVSSNLYKLSHPVYNMCMIAFAKNPTLTPAELEASGAKILGHISGSLLMDLRPESVSGEYVMDNSSIIMNTDNFGLATTQLRFLAGGLFNTNMYTLTNRQDYKPYGTFRNVERLEYTKYLGDSHRTAATRDKYISAYDCPLLRVDDNTYDYTLTATGDLTLRRCIVPKGTFVNDVVNGNTYEDIDFSYTTEFLGNTEVPNRILVSSHKQGLYNLRSGVDLLGRISYPDNAKDAVYITEAHGYIPLDGNLIEQGTYEVRKGQNYAYCKIGAGDRVRMSTPIPTKGLVFPSLPTGYKVRYAYYLDEAFNMVEGVEEPITVNIDIPYVLFAFRKEDSSALLSVSEFIALGQSLRLSDYMKVPEITGSAYVGAGVIVRGDVQLHGDPYVNRVFDVNMWERGENTMINQQTWEDGKNLTNQERHVEFKEAFPVEANGMLSANSGYFMYAGWMDENKRIIATSGVWASSFVVPATAKYVGLVLKKASGAAATGGFIEDSDIPLANVKYLRAFKRLRYITNELDRKSPEDILLTPDYWEQGSMSSGEANAGKTYEELKTVYTKAIRLKRPINVFMPGQNTSQGAGFNVSRQLFDALTRLYAPVTDAVSHRTALITLVTVKSDASDVLPSDAPNSRVYIEFTPSPRIVAPYGYDTITVGGVKLRMYDNAVLSKPMDVSKQEGGTIILKGNAVARYDFITIPCFCSNGHSDAIIP